MPHWRSTASDVHADHAVLVPCARESQSLHGAAYDLLTCKDVQFMIKEFTLPLGEKGCSRPPAAPDPPDPCKALHDMCIAHISMDIAGQSCHIGYMHGRLLFVTPSGSVLCMPRRILLTTCTDMLTVTCEALRHAEHAAMMLNQNAQQVSLTRPAKSYK